MTQPHRRARRPRLLLALTVIAIAVVGTACQADHEPTPGHTGGSSVTRLPEPDDVVDEALMIALAQAKNFHHKAKVYMADGKLTDATAQVQAVLAIPFPAGAPEGDDVRLDARAMLGKLLSAQGKVDEAMSVVDQGIGSARRESFFLANLYTVKGELHEARATLLDEQGEPARARAQGERRAAIVAFDRSIQINEAIQKQLFEQRRPAPGAEAPR